MHYYIQYRVRGKGIVGPYKKAVQREVARYSPVGDSVRNKFDLTSPNISFVLPPIYHFLILFFSLTFSKGKVHSLSGDSGITRHFLYELSTRQTLLVKKFLTFSGVNPYIFPCSFGM